MASGSRDILSDSLDAYAEASQQRQTPGRNDKAMADSRVRIAQRGDVDHGNMPTLSWANNLRDSTTPQRQRPRTITPSRAMSQSPERRSAHSSPHRSHSPYGRDNLSARAAYRSSPSPGRAHSPGRHNNTAPYVIGVNHGKVKNFTSFSSPGRRRASTTSKRSNSPATSSILRRQKSTRTGTTPPSQPMRHGTPPKYFGAPPKVAKRKADSSRSHSPSSSGRLSPGRVAGRHGATHQKIMDDPTTSAGWSWLEQEEHKLSDALKQCSKEAEREWSRMQRGHPELKKIPMPNLGGSWHDRMWQEVKWMLKRKVEEQEARGKRMALRIQRLEEDASQADSRRADLERAMGSMANSHEKELQESDRKVEELQREKEVLLDELEKRCKEIKQANAQLEGLRKNEETTTWAFKTAVTNSENATYEMKNEVNRAKEAVEEEKKRLNTVERARESERMEAEAKIGMLESQMETMRILSTEMEGEINRLQNESVHARKEVDEEKQRSAHALHDMQRKLSVWSEEGSLAIQEARKLAAMAEDRAQQRERGVAEEAKESLLEMELLAKGEHEKLRKEMEKERRTERDELHRKAASEKIALEARFKAEMEKFRREAEERFEDQKKQLDEDRTTAEAAHRCEVEAQKRALIEVQQELSAVNRELVEAEERNDEYEKVLEAATESRGVLLAAKETSEHLSSVARDDVKMLKRIISTLQIELAGFVFIYAYKRAVPCVWSLLSGAPCGLMSNV